MRNLIFGVTVIVITLVVFADSDSPYKHEKVREIKALSKQEVAGYLSGKGLGFAKAAELNSYPGPSHVVDLAKELDLTNEQTRQTQTVFNVMKAQATKFGKKLIEKEQELDRQFANGTIDADSLKTLLLEIETLRANIRYVHLNAHLEEKALLTKHQIQLYDQLRGYETSHSEGHNYFH